MDGAPPQADILAVGERLAAALPSSRGPIRSLDDRAMDLAANDPELRAALFRFVDVAPACRDLDDLARHLTGFLDEAREHSGREPPPPLQVARRMASTRPGRAALGAAAAAGVRHMAHRFIVGRTPRDAAGVLRDLWDQGVATSVDLLGEMTVTAAEADRYAARCHEALDELACVAQQLAQPAGGVATAQRRGVRAQERRQGRDLHREVHARERPGAVALERRPRGQRRAATRRSTASRRSTGACPPSRSSRPTRSGRSPGATCR